jgi:anti-sigma regulatory factor (Ser/Thr protein kinase)
VAGESETLTLPPEPQSAGAARRFTRHVCRQAHLDPDTSHSAILLTSETVTNAIIHGRSEVRLTVIVRAHGVRVEVGDDNSRPPVAQAEDPNALDGRGMAMIQATASAWGVERAAYGKVVWFEIDAAPAPGVNPS